MTEKEVVKEALSRLYIIRSTTSSPTKEAEWLEGVINCIITHAGEKTHGFNREDDSPLFL